MPTMDVLPRNFYTDLVERYGQQTKRPQLQQIQVSRPGVDYNAFYESLGLVGQASKAATEVTRQQAMNTAAQRFLEEQQSLANLAQQQYDLSNVVPQFIMPGGAPAHQTGGRYTQNLPLQRYRVSSGYGPRGSVQGSMKKTSSYHTGIDLAAPTGTPIYATHDGRVTLAGWSGYFGNTIKLSGGNIITQYSHNSRNLVRPGQFVKAGQIIGYVGATGNVTGPHLHYQVYIGGRLVNPTGYHRF